MDRSDIITLLDVRHETDESGTEKERIASRSDVYCFVSSVGMKESYTAMSVGHNPEFKATIPEYADYHGENYAIRGGSVYKILRTYMVGIGVELTLERTRDLEGMV